ncbi:Transmembrane protein 115 [Auxenochlorella protothecoides]|uniref:Transmembrane protein 115 n=1 Tax=Auxenochlorella protothecoides TaxID=3075 RepID=A0A087SK88_AUXPR|nr:Transmembrane protein 115 [Auxenochlorella protothecoides]KFM26142.1 Transmembrane protein 115 [Auxenochlorella protothecoides]
MRARLEAAAGSVPPVTRGLIGTLISGYLIQLIFPAAKTHLGLVLLTSLAAAAVLGRAVEGQLGGRETLVTLCSALVGASLCAWVWVTATFAVAVSTSSTAAARAGDALYDPILGFHGATAALLVALKQVVPENEVTLFSHFSFRFKYLPSLFVLVAAVFGVLTGRTLRTLPFVVGGTLASWAYLRFVQPQAGSGRGTPGADFSFASFFPEPVAPLAEQLAVLCSRLTGLRAAERSVPSVGSGLGLGGAVLPGTGAADAARRSFVDLARQKQAGNPEYGFLTGGDGAAFFTWRLFAAVNHLPADQPLAAGWAQVLAALSGSHTSIRASQEWFMACRQHAQGMAEMMLQASKATQEAAKQLHLLYLANDVLFKALPSRPTGSTPEADAVAEAFCPRLGTMLRHAFLAGGQTDEAQAPLLKMVNHWAEKRIYSQATIERMTMELLGAAANGRTATGAWVSGRPPPAHVQAAPLAEPEPPGFDPMSFPPGLIPKLVEESLKVDPPYSPLTIRAVSEAGVPPPPQVDVYLSARLDKFYAQIADYRPSMQFVDLETEPPRRRTFVDRGTEERVHRTTPAEPSEQKVDVFNKYRSMLSGAYFEQIHRSLAKRGG